jgi:A/G-specific adenine glycosylase
MARLENDGGDVGSSAVRRRLGEEAARRLDRAAPGTFNQAMMELGATICLPRNPRCGECPVAKFCKARLAGSQNQLPVKLRREVRTKVREKVLLIVRRGKVLMQRRGGSDGRLAGFWELPGADVPGARIVRKLGQFRHAITRHDYSVEVYAAKVNGTPPGCFWVALSTLCKFPVTSIAKKAMRWYQ